MRQFLSRGYQLSSNKRIRKLIAGADDWQIYITNLDSYVLAAKPSLYAEWVNLCSLPVGIFTDSDTGEYKLLCSSGSYLIASVREGPFPQDSRQIEAFSIAFRIAAEKFANIDLSDAVYIEEYSLLLPTSFEEPTEASGVIYGRWLTGGVDVSIDDFDRVSRFMSWLPNRSLKNAAGLAGFNIPETDHEANSAADTETVNPDRRTACDVPAPLDTTLETKESFQLIGRPDLEQFLRESIIDIVLHQEQYKRMGIPFPGATVLYGPPGCGKTYAVQRLSEYLGWPCFSIDSSTIASSYIHDTSRKISAVFDNAIKVAPSIIVIDEMEAFLSKRTAEGASGIHHMEEVGEFLRRIPDAASKGVLIFAMTNMLEAIDPAILRRGRFDHIIEVKMASAEEIEQLLRHRFEELPVNDTVDAHKIAAALNEHPLSDVTFVLREAGRFAVKRNLDQISDACFEDALKMLPRHKEQKRIGFGKS